MDITPRKTKKQRRQQITKDLLTWLSVQPGRMAREIDFKKRIGRISDFQSLISSPEFAVFSKEGERWVTAKGDLEAVLSGGNFVAIDNNGGRRSKTPAERVGDVNPKDESPKDGNPKDQNPEDANPAGAARKKLAMEKRKERDLAWQALIPLCGDVMRPEGGRGKSGRLHVIARTYTPESAAQRLGFSTGALRGAAVSGDLTSFTDPEGKIRIPAAVVEQAAGDENILERIGGNTRLKARDISIVLGISFPTVRNRLRKAHISTTDPLWKQIRGQWGLPGSLTAFNTILEERYPAWLELIVRDRSTNRYPPQDGFDRKSRQEREETRRLRQQLIEVFPTWDRNRAEQHITLHMGPTNSGKTFSGLNNLSAAGSGWYLSPLRLLAHEVYETLNRRGVFCSLLTGEETIEVPGAQVIAATIEMFNPQRSGDCIIIDEAHMLADEQRGWAWTRAIME
ncbi:MAG: hypothetical protein IH586_23370, partial [Anaerolineaceae bacterium]|nr:hypothetical protein [Anaerolineaceae bacterium]